MNEYGRVEIYSLMVSLSTRWQPVGQDHAPTNLLPMEKSRIAIGQ